MENKTVLKAALLCSIFVASGNVVAMKKADTKADTVKATLTTEQYNQAGKELVELEKDTEWPNVDAHKARKKRTLEQRKACAALSSLMNLQFSMTRKGKEMTIEQYNEWQDKLKEAQETLIKVGSDKDKALLAQKSVLYNIDNVAFDSDDESDSDDDGDEVEG